MMNFPVVCLRRAVFFLLLFALLCTCASAQDDYAVTAVKFTGNTSFLPSTLLSQMKTYATSMWRRSLLRKKPFWFNDEVLREDVQRLQRFYQTEGFVQVHIAAPTLQINADRTIEINISIVEGEPVLVRRMQHQLIAATAADSVFALTHLAKQWPLLALQPGLRFRDVAVQDDAEIIRQKLANAGYAYVRVQPELEILPHENRVDVSFKVNTGPRCIFGDIRIAGTKYTSPELIRDQLMFEKGEMVRQESLTKSRERIYSLGLFQVITIRPQLTQVQMAVIPIEIFVKESPRLTLKFGVGYSLEAFEVLEESNFWDGLRFSVNLRRLAFLGGARRLGLLAKYSALEPYNFNIEFAQAAFLFPKNTLIVSPYTLKQIDPAYKLSKFGGDVILRQQLALKTSSFVGYNLEQVDLSEETAASQASAQEQASDIYNKSSISWGFVHDTSFPLFSPKGGSLYSAGFKYSGRPPDIFGFKLESQFNFFKALLENRYYFAMKRNSIFAYRLKIGALHAFDMNGIPVEERFFAGGSNSVRGWAYKQLGPKENDTPIGGNSLLEGSGELRYAIVSRLYGALFLDFGNVSVVDLDYAFKKLHYSMGTGLRFETSFGPIRLDVARPIADEEEDVRLHFNFGHAF
ncbi:MAG: BamA/OMP85 family outer membrane protein [bacterium]